MSERVHHCPFLNRSDARCSTHFSLDSLSAAFEHCLGAYAACPSYRELLAERRTRRGEPVDAAWASHPEGPTAARPDRADLPLQHHGSPTVPVTVSAAASARHNGFGRPHA